MTMTTKTQEKVPHGQLFSLELFMSVYTALNRDAGWHEIAVRIDGYSDMQRRLAKLQSWRGSSSRIEGEEVWDRAIDVATETGDVEVAFEPVRKILEARAHEQDVNRLHQTALSRLQAEAEEWVKSEPVQAAFVGLMNDEIGSLLQAARDASVIVDGARSFDEIGADAPRAAAFAELSVSARRLQERLRTAEAVLSPVQPGGYSTSQLDPRRWPLVWAIANYQTAWPRFWRRERLTILQSRGRDLVLHEMPAPWDGLQPVEFLVWALDRGVQFSVVTARGAAQRSETLDKAARELRQEAAKSRTDADWITDGGVVTSL